MMRLALAVVAMVSQALEVQRRPLKVERAGAAAGGPRRRVYPPAVRGGATMTTGSLFAAACPVVGIVTSTALYSSSLPTVLERAKAGALGELNPSPTERKRRGALLCCAS